MKCPWALGLEAAGFDTVALLEKDANACAALKFNRPDWNILEADVRDVDYRRFGPIDLVAGGPPCQPFSMGGKAKGYEDTRDMFPEAVRAVRELQPNALLRSKFVTHDYWKKHRLRPAAPSPMLERKIAALRYGELFSTTEPWRTVRDAVFDLSSRGKGETIRTTIANRVPAVIPATPAAHWMNRQRP